MDITFTLGQESDLNTLEQLYDAINDYLQTTINYCGWEKGLYPNRETASEGIETQTLFVAKYGEHIVGSIILNHLPEPAYHGAPWLIDTDYNTIFVIHTLVVHPNYLKCGIGEKMLQFATTEAKRRNIQSIRLDVYEANLPAIRLYEKCGFTFIDTVDLGLGMYGLDWFKLYEKLV